LALCEAATKKQGTTLHEECVEIRTSSCQTHSSMVQRPRCRGKWWHQNTHK